MTAITPEQLRYLAALIVEDHPPNDSYTGWDVHEFLGFAADALAAVSAERDQARQMLADAPHARDCMLFFDTIDGSVLLGKFKRCTCWKSNSSDSR